MNFIGITTNSITVIFFLVVTSYYVILFLPLKRKKEKTEFSSISVIIPAHNEEKHIRECIESVERAEFSGRKEIIVVDDGSKDKTAEVAGSYKSVKLIKCGHSGKSASMNKALEVAREDIVAIVDADSIIEKSSLNEITKEIARNNLAAACSVVKVENRKKYICMWYEVEQLYNSLMRLIFSKVNANITTPGPLSAYRTSVLKKIGGFSTEGYSEDQDITIRLIRNGYNVGFCERAVSSTYLPYDLRGVFRQRIRFAKGALNILKRHLKFENKLIDYYTMPLVIFGYAQAVIMGLFTLYNIINGYIKYFFFNHVYFSWNVIWFFLNWLTVIGVIQWAGGIFTGATPLTIINLIGIFSTLLTYPLYIIAIIKFERNMDIWHMIPLFIMSPFWLFIMLIYIISLPSLFKASQYNKWEKNE